MPPHGRALPIVAGLAVVPPGFGATASGGDIILGIRLGERNGAPLLDIAALASRSRSSSASTHSSAGRGRPPASPSYAAPRTLLAIAMKSPARAAAVARTSRLISLAARASATGALARTISSPRSLRIADARSRDDTSVHPPSHCRILLSCGERSPTLLACELAEELCRRANVGRVALENDLPTSIADPKRVADRRPTVCDPDFVGAVGSPQHNLVERHHDSDKRRIPRPAGRHSADAHIGQRSGGRSTAIP